MPMRLCLPAAALALLTACASTTTSTSAPQTPAPASATTSAPASASPAAVQPPAAAALPRTSPPASAQANGPYLFELLKSDPAQRAWRSMAASRKAPQWIGRAEGPTVPTQALTLNGQRYWQGSLCQTHNCPNTFFFLLGADRAYGLHADLNQPHTARPVLYGKPPQAERAALQQAFEQARQQQIQRQPPGN